MSNIVIPTNIVIPMVKNKSGGSGVILVIKFTFLGVLLVKGIATPSVCLPLGF